MSKLTKIILGIVIAVLLLIGFILWRRHRTTPTITPPKTSDEQAAAEDYAAFLRRNPLAKDLPYGSEHFTIALPDKNDVYVITLNAPFNAGVNGPPIEEQIKLNQSTVTQYKKEALDWIRSRGIDPNKLKIRFEF